MVNIGMIGYNEGNGHPYSFSAIINGYDSESMKKSPYPVIFEYLSRRTDSDFGIGDFKVTHIWSPDITVSKNIAEAALIPNVVHNFHDLAGKVDVVIIARDDVESHFALVDFFLKEGLVVFVDKPLCNNIKHLDYFMPYLEKAQLMSGSGLRYHPDISSSFQNELRKDEICFVNAISVLDWFKYGIHVLEAVTPIMGYDIEQVSNLNDKNNTVVKITYKSGQYVLIQIGSKCFNGMKADFYTTNKIFSVKFDDNFFYFKKMLEAFYQMIVTKQPAIKPMETYHIVKTIIEGAE